MAKVIPSVVLACGLLGVLVYVLVGDRDPARTGIGPPTVGSTGNRSGPVEVQVTPRRAPVSHQQGQEDDEEEEQAEVSHEQALNEDFEEKYGHLDYDHTKAEHRIICHKMASIAQPLIHKKWDLGDYEEHGPIAKDAGFHIDPKDYEGAALWVTRSVPIEGQNARWVRIAKVFPSEDEELVELALERDWLLRQERRLMQERRESQQTDR